MKKVLLMMMLLFLLFISSVSATVVTEKEARTVAENWIYTIISLRGEWGGAQTAEVSSIQAFNSDELFLGYFCEVKPQGFIIVSPLKGLSPIKAYSTKDNANPELEVGLIGFTKLKLKDLLESITSELGSIESIKYDNLREILESDHTMLWDRLISGEPIRDYSEGQEMIETYWHQDDPFNDDCPDMGCEDTHNGHAWAGCVAIAGAQVMKYWGWPPYTQGGGINFEWENMPGFAYYGSPQVYQDALAELVSDIGDASGMFYGCDGSGAAIWLPFGSSLASALIDRYKFDNGIDINFRITYSESDWFDLMKHDLDNNCPLIYAYGPSEIISDEYDAHAFVADGWRIVDGTKEIHLNMGWSGASNGWYSLDGILGHSIELETCLSGIRPDPSVGPYIGGNYSLPSFIYRYFNRDATNRDLYGMYLNTSFAAGHNLQFLHGIKVMCVDPNNDGLTIKFKSGYGSNDDYTSLYTRGDRTQGIDLKEGGTLVLRKGGFIKFH